MGEGADVIARDLAATAGPFANDVAIVFGGARVRTIQETGQTAPSRPRGVAGETTSTDWAGDEVVPELQCAVFAEAVGEAEVNREAEVGAGCGGGHEFLRGFGIDLSSVARTGDTVKRHH